MVSLVELVGSSFIYFLLFTVTLIALWSYAIFSKGTAQPLDSSVLTKDDPVSAGKRATKNRSKNKRGSPERKQESREQVGNKPKPAEAKLTREVINRTTAENTDNDPQANVDPVFAKVEASRNNALVTIASGRSKQKGKKKAAATKQEHQEKKDVVTDITDDTEGGWKVKLSRQQLRAHREQQRQNQSSHDPDHQALKVEEIGDVATAPCEKQSVEDSTEVEADKAKDSLLNQGVEFIAHSDDPADIERALKEAADSSPSPETTEAPWTWGSRQHKKRIRQKCQPDSPSVRQPPDEAKDQSQEDWVIL